MLLSVYIARTQKLLQSPAAPSSLYSEANLIGWINEGRLQVSGEGECIRYLGSIDTTISNRLYNLASISTGDSETNGIGGALKVNSIMFGVADGYLPLQPQSWEYFQTYLMASPVPNSGQPADWAQYGQGSTGSFYIDPIPDAVYTLACDCVCYPIDLEDDESIDAIPKFWSDAVPYFAAYLALLSAQTQQRQADADRMLQRYSFFAERARTFSNPLQQGYLYSQAKDKTQANKFASRGPGAT